MYPKLKAEINQNEILNQVLKESLEYLSTVKTRKVAPVVHKNQKTDLPEEGLGAMAALRMFNQKYKDKIITSNGSRYFGFVVGGATPAAIAGDWLTSVFDQCATGIPTDVDWHVEQEALALLNSLLGLPEQMSGVCVSGATMANFVGLAIARQWVGNEMGVNISEEGLHKLPQLKIVSGSAHASVFKTMAMLGIGRKSLSVIPTLPGREAVDIGELENFLKEHQDTPVIVIANAGTVNTTDFDDLKAIMALRNQYNIWVHVDAAFAGIALCSDKYRHLMTGIELADSITIDAHKWLNVPYDSAFLMTQHPNLQAEVFSNGAASVETGSSITPTFNKVPENSRRFRALPVWMTLMAYGKKGYAEIVERNCQLAREFSRKVEKSNYFSLLTSTNLNIVCFTLKHEKEITSDFIREFLEKVREDGTCFLTPTNLNGIPGMRLAISNWKTEEADIEKTWEALKSIRKSIRV